MIWIVGILAVLVLLGVVAVLLRNERQVKRAADEYAYGGLPVIDFDRERLGA